MDDTRVRYRYWRYYAAGEEILTSYEVALQRAFDNIDDANASPHAIETLDGKVILDGEAIYDLWGDTNRKLFPPGPASLPVTEKG